MDVRDLDEIQERLAGAEAAITMLARAIHRLSPPDHQKLVAEAEAALQRSAHHPFARSAALYAKRLVSE